MNRGPFPILKRLPHTVQIALHWPSLVMLEKKAKHLIYCVYYTNSEYA